MKLMGIVTIVVLTAFPRPSSSQVQCADMCTCSADAMGKGIIDCSNRGLTETPEVFHRGVGSIARINLSGNLLTSVDLDRLYSQIRGLRIEVLDFSSNQIDSLVGRFESLYDFTTLNMSNNLFTTFPGNAIPVEHQRATLILDFSSNRLTTLTRHMFAGGNAATLFGFKFLASNNMISQIDDEVFGGVQIVDTVFDVRDNQLTTLSENFQNPSGVMEFKFAGNPWNCDCNLRWILDPARSIINHTRFDPPNCQNPMSLRGQPLFKLGPREFTCLPYQDGTLRRDINDQDSFTLTCPVAADPPNPVITWTVWLPCPDDGNPLRFFFESDEITLSDIVTNPRAAYRCTAINNAGTVDLDLDVRYNGVGGIGFPEVSNQTPTPSPSLPPGVTVTTPSSTVTPPSSSEAGTEGQGSSKGTDGGSPGPPVAGIIILVILLLISWAAIGFLVYRIWVLKKNQHQQVGSRKATGAEYQENGNGAVVHTITTSPEKESYTEVEKSRSNGRNGWSVHPEQNGVDYATPHRNPPLKPATPFKPMTPMKPPGLPNKPPKPPKPFSPYQYNTEVYDDPPAVRFGLRNEGYDYNNGDSVI